MARRTKALEPGLSKVRSVIDGLVLDGTISIAAAATHLETSPRTLQRRLKRGGVGFWALVEQSRFKIASALLRETDLQVQDVAAKLGYATPGAFARAFAKWAGCSPSVFRNAPQDGSQATRHWREMGSRRAVPSLGSIGMPDPTEES